MKRTGIYTILALAVASMAATSCSDDIDLVIPHATNITFDEVAPSQRFSHVIKQGGFDMQGIHFNAVTSGAQLSAGFCASNRSMRSFTWTGTEAAIDSVRYSTFSTRPNTTGTYLVCHVSGDDAFFTMSQPRVIEYILVSNTTWAYNAMTYGDTFGTAEEPKANPYVPSAPKGVWQSYVPGGVKKFGQGDWFTLTAKGFNQGRETGSLTFDLSCKKGHNTTNPDWDYIVNNWTRFDLAGLGAVDKVVFYLDSSDKDEHGNMRTPAWFCLDGLQLRQ